MPPRHTYSKHAPAKAALVLFAALTTGCRDVGPAFGPTIPAARANAEGLFGGIAQRFTNVQRNAKFSVARGKMGKNALTPSVILTTRRSGPQSEPTTHARPRSKASSPEVAISSQRSPWSQRR